jgi:hypothetical protein
MTSPGARWRWSVDHVWSGAWRRNVGWQGTHFSVASPILRCLANGGRTGGGAEGVANEAIGSTESVNADIRHSPPPSWRVRDRNGSSRALSRRRSRPTDSRRPRPLGIASPIWNASFGTTERLSTPSDPRHSGGLSAATPGGADRSARSRVPLWPCSRLQAR